MYITGGIGAHAAGESFGDAYELPSESAYAETCASIASILWNFRLLTMTGDARYADLVERTLYNAAAAGMSLSGTQYCYRNPLASGGDRLRNPWYDTTCCPPNIERLFESLPGYLYSTSRDGIYVNLYENSELDWHLDDGSAVKLAQTTDYPWSGSIRIKVTPEKTSDFTLYVRWPEWANSMTVAVNGTPWSTAANRPQTYLALSRTWNAGDTVSISFPMPAFLNAANPRVSETYGRVAVQRGPLIYALEQLDQSGASLGDLFIRPGSTITLENRKDLLNGITLLKSPGQVAEKPLGEEELYQPLASTLNRAKRPATLTFIPYYAVGNRDPTPMEVWVPFVHADSPPSPSPSIVLPTRAGASR
jgi:DUF1680 family protein